MEVDIVILSNAKTGALRHYTQHSVDTCIQADPGIKFNIFVLEGNEEVIYNHCQTIHITEPFNYNGFMNKGIALGKAEYVCLCNNDLEFHKGWATNIIQAMEQEYLLSASPLCPRSQGARFTGPPIHYGYQPGEQMSGWCIMINRFLLDIIGKLNDDPRWRFWFADNVYAEQLIQHNVKHALIRSSIVTHKGQRTLSKESKEVYDAYTEGAIVEFVKEYPHTASAKFFRNARPDLFR